MASPAQLKLEISYLGSTEYVGFGKWDIDDIDLNFNGINKDISASINKEVPPNQEQILEICIKDNSSVLPKVDVVNRINMIPQLAKTMTLSARMFQTYENRQVTINGKGEMRSDARISPLK